MGLDGVTGKPANGCVIGTEEKGNKISVLRCKVDVFDMQLHLMIYS